MSASDPFFLPEYGEESLRLLILLEECLGSVSAYIAMSLGPFSLIIEWGAMDEESLEVLI